MTMPKTNEIRGRIEDALEELDPDDRAGILFNVLSDVIGENPDAALTDLSGWLWPDVFTRRVLNALIMLAVEKKRQDIIGENHGDLKRLAARLEPKNRAKSR